jgi:hypothetical protein
MTADRKNLTAPDGTTISYLTEGAGPAAAPPSRFRVFGEKLVEDRRRPATGRNPHHPRPRHPGRFEAATRSPTISPSARRSPARSRRPCTSPGQDHLGQRILQRLLDHPLQRARAIDRVVALVGQPGPRRLVELQRDLALGQPLLAPPAAAPSWIATMPSMSLAAQPVEDDLVERFRNSGRKCARTASITSRFACAASAPRPAAGSAPGSRGSRSGRSASA